MSGLGWKSILAVDSDKAAAAVFRANFPDVDMKCDVVRPKSLPRADILLGGPPCQPFSVSGKRKGEDDERNCVPDFVAAIKQVRPRMFLMEQVPGFVHHQDGRVAQRTVRAMQQLGYDVDVRILDAVEFGVPQFRQRAWFWGIRKDLGLTHAWPNPTHRWPPQEGDSLFGDDLPTSITVGQALGINGAIRRMRGSGVDRRDHPTGEPSPTVMDGSNGGAAVLRFVDGAPILYRWSDEMLSRHPPADIDRPAPSIRAKFEKSGAEGLLSLDKLSKDGRTWDDRHPMAVPTAPSPTIRARSPRDGGRCLEGVIWQDDDLETFTMLPHGNNVGYVRTTQAPAPGMRGGLPGCSDMVLPIDAITFDNATFDADEPIGDDGALDVGDSANRPSPTITGGGKENGSGGPEPIAHRKRAGFVRRLTVPECARLQSVPDDWIWPDEVKRGPRYRVIGNGWACGMARHLSMAFKAVDPESVTVIDLFCGGGLGTAGWHGRAWRYQPEGR